MNQFDGWGWWRSLLEHKAAVTLFCPKYFAYLRAVSFVSAGIWHTESEKEKDRFKNPIKVYHVSDWGINWFIKAAVPCCESTQGSEVTLDKDPGCDSQTLFLKAFLVSNESSENEKLSPNTEKNRIESLKQVSALFVKQIIG